MRRAISTIIATALLLGGAWLCWEWFMLIAPNHDMPYKASRFTASIGAFMSAAGGIGLAADWFDLWIMRAHIACHRWSFDVGRMFTRLSNSRIFQYKIPKTRISKTIGRKP